MSIRFYCPHGHRLKVPEEKAGKSARCPVCQERVVVPLESSARPLKRNRDLAVKEEAASFVGEVVAEDACDAAAAASTTIDALPVAPPAPPREDNQLFSRNVIAEAAPTQAGATSSEHSANDTVGSHPQVGMTARRTYWASFDSNLPRKAYCLADTGKRHLVRWTALAVALIACFQVAPAAQFWNLFYAPDWAKWVVVLSALQLVFALYLAILPSWPSLWVTVVLLGGMAAIYAAAMAIVAATPAGRPMLFELDDWRRTAAPWAACNVLLLGLLAYGCGRAATRWQRSWMIAYAHRND